MSDTRRHTTRVDEPTAEQARPWWHTDVEGRPVTFWMVVGTLIAAVTLGVGAFWTYGLDRDQQAQAMGGDGAMSGGGMDAMSPDAPRVPAVFGYVDGEAMAFMHTEASDLTIIPSSICATGLAGAGGPKSCRRPRLGHRFGHRVHQRYRPRRHAGRALRLSARRLRRAARRPRVHAAAARRDGDVDRRVQRRAAHQSP